MDQPDPIAAYRRSVASFRRLHGEERKLHDHVGEMLACLEALLDDIEAGENPEESREVFERVYAVVKEHYRQFKAARRAV